MLHGIPLTMIEEKSRYYSENFGNPVLEAMRRRVPVVVTPEVGAADIVRASGSGIVVARDPEPLGAAICRLTTDLVSPDRWAKPDDGTPRRITGITSPTDGSIV